MESRRQFRVIDLLPPLPGDDDDVAAPIRCAIRPVQLSDSGAWEQYETLSYVWGAQTTLVPIAVSDNSVHITPSLLAALRQVRLRDRKRTLWIDQLCINQWDAAEKASQVRLMRQLYSSCSRCLVWLGDIPRTTGVSLQDAQAAFDLIRYIAAGAEATDDDYGPVPSFLAGVDLSGPAAQRAVEALRYVVWQGNNWWKRVWTVQEAVLPPVVILKWGPFSISWATLLEAASVMNGSRG